MRIYDPRLGRFLSVDPLAKEYPWNSPYSFAENSPIQNIDLDGMEKFPVEGGAFGSKTWKSGTHLGIMNRIKVVRQMKIQAASTKRSLDNASNFDAQKLSSATGNADEETWYEDSWEFTKTEIWPRAVGTLKTAGGVITIGGSTLLLEFGIGVPGVAYGADLAQAGFRQMIDGESDETVTKQLLISAGVSEQTANTIETAIGFAAINEATNALSFTKSAPTVEDVPAAKGGKELFNFSTKAAEHMANPGRAVPVQILEQAIKGSKGLADPRGSRALMHTTEMFKNGKAYNLEVLYDKATNPTWHFKYSPIKP